jgi:hypothetical protein
VLSNQHDPEVLSQIMLMLPHYLTQTTPDAIANYRISQAPRGNEADTTKPGIGNYRCVDY